MIAMRLRGGGGVNGVVGGQDQSAISVFVHAQS